MWKLSNDFWVVDFRQKLGFHLASQCRCRRSFDSTNHIFLHCSLVQDFWWCVATHLGFSNFPWASFRTLKDCVSFCWICGQDKRLFINKLFCILICWCLWISRCQIFFYGISPSVGSTFRTFLTLLHKLGLAKDLNVLPNRLSSGSSPTKFIVVYWEG